MLTDEEIVMRIRNAGRKPNLTAAREMLAEVWRDVRSPADATTTTQPVVEHEQEQQQEQSTAMSHPHLRRENGRPSFDWYLLCSKRIFKCNHHDKCHECDLPITAGSWTYLTASDNAKRWNSFVGIAHKACGDKVVADAAPSEDRQQPLLKVVE